MSAMRRHGVKLISNVYHGQELEWDVCATNLSSALQSSFLILQIRRLRPGEKILGRTHRNYQGNLELEPGVLTLSV